MIKKEIGFGVNNFGKVNILSDIDSLAQLIKNILFLKPGQLPSMPFIGVDILNHLNPMISSIELDNLSMNISQQCSALVPHMDFSGVTVESITHQNVPVLLIIIPLSIADEDKTLLLGVRQTTNGRVIFNYEIDESLLA